MVYPCLKFDKADNNASLCVCYGVKQKLNVRTSKGKKEQKCNPSSKFSVH